jgi:hypothetical protein
MWINTVNGAINLDRVFNVVVQSNGDAWCFVDGSNYFVVSGIDSTSAGTKSAIRKVVESVDAATYV